MSEITKVYSGDAVKRVAMKLHAKPHVVPTGLPRIDRDFLLWGDRRGIPRGQYVIIGGASNIGKSRFSSFLLRQAVKYGEPAALVSLEDSLENLLAMYFMELDAVPFRDWLPSRWTKEHTKALATKVKSVAMESAAPLYVTSAESRSDLSAVLENIYELVEAGVKFLVVDHLQLVKSEGFRSDYERSVYVSETIREVKAKTGITIVGLSQLKRTAAEDYSRTPIIQDLHGGTSMESNTDTVLLLDHSLYATDPQNRSLARTFVVNGKNRLGPRGYSVPVLVDHQTITYREALQDEEYLWPSRDDG